MLAGAEEEFQRPEFRDKMSAIQSLLAGLFDYAGLYPPASLSMRSAANNYVEYASGKHAAALGWFIVNVSRLEELRSVAGESLERFRFSVIATNIEDCDVIAEKMRKGMPIEAVELKDLEAEEIESARSKFPESMIIYVEVPLGSEGLYKVEAISRSGARAKIRTGGIVPEAIPPISALVQTLAALARLNLPFKATAGLHHPVRSMRPLTYRPNGPTGTMHGFLNLCCAAAVLYFGGDVKEASEVMAEEDASAWDFDSGGLSWRNLSWTEEQLRILRRDFFAGIGTCSFDEPIQDLTSLGWL
jgi:hypothetical protein